MNYGIEFIKKQVRKTLHLGREHKMVLRKKARYRFPEYTNKENMFMEIMVNYKNL